MGQDAGDMLREIGHMLKATHISDVLSVGGERIIPFLEKADWRSVVRALHEIDYNGDLTLDVRRFTGGLPDELFPAALKYSVSVGEYLLSFDQQQ